MRIDTFYRERANGHWEYWTYSDGIKVRLSPSRAEKEIARKTAILVTVR